MSADYMTTKQLAKALGLTPRGVRWNIERGRIKAYRVPGWQSHYRIPRLEVERMLRGRV